MNPRELLASCCDEALASLSDALRLDAAFEDMPAKKLKERYQAYSCGWVCDPSHLKSGHSLDVVIPKHFPDVLPDVYLSDISLDLFLENPHVLKSGRICIVPDSSSLDTSEPVELVRYAVESANNILAGKIQEDFLDEFTSYWSMAGEGNTHKFFLVDNVDNLADVAVSVVLKGYLLVGVSLENIEKWWSAFRPDSSLTMNARKCLVVRLPSPLSPAEYPRSAHDLVELFQQKAPDHAKRLKAHLCDSHEFLAVLFVQDTDDGPALAGVLTKGMGLSNLKECFKGFRPGKVPRELVLKRGKHKLSKGILEASRVLRVDHSWIHTRGGSGHTFADKRVVLLGCGSLGGYVTHLLARMGIGSITLVDNDTLEWNNIGRHILGSGDVGQNKAEALSRHLQVEMPHLSLSAESKDWRDWIQEREDVLSNVDLIVSTMAQWNSERLLNKMARRLSFPPLLFAWLEPYAVAGHVLSVRQEGGCLACGVDRFGHFSRNVADFSGTTFSKEPGGCTHYQRYGPVGLWPTASMIVDAVMMHLRADVKGSTLHTLTQSEEMITEYGATISRGWKKILVSGLSQQIHCQDWTKDKECPECN